MGNVMANFDDNLDESRNLKIRRKSTDRRALLEKIN